MRARSEWIKLTVAHSAVLIFVNIVHRRHAFHGWCDGRICEGGTTRESLSRLSLLVGTQDKVASTMRQRGNQCKESPQSGLVNTSPSTRREVREETMAISETGLVPNG